VPYWHDDIGKSFGALMLIGRRTYANVSFILVDASGGGPPLHRHPYQELFVVHEGRALYTIGSTFVEVWAGQIVIVPSGLPHKFVNSGEGSPRQTDIHLSKRFETEWVET
jgi:mannose-6-phosphate isomerase-like protein (cupin superfamily)